MKVQQKILIGLLTILLFSLLANRTTFVFAQAITPSPLSPTATPTPVRSIFDGDPCAPPCWFGLIPGESTGEDVESLLETFDDVFDLRRTSSDSTFDVQTGHMVDGAYILVWHRGQDKPNYSGATIYVEDGVLVLIEVSTHRRVLLDEVLNAFGSPDEVYLSEAPYGSPILVLAYSAWNYTVVLISEPDKCSVSNLGESFWVETVVYKAPGRTYTYSTGTDRRVPSETWESWLQEEVGLDCLSAHRLLPETTPTPRMITETPEQ